MSERGVFNRLRRNLADLLAPEQGPLHAPPPPPPPRAAAPASEPGFEAKLKAMLLQSGSASLLAGRVNIIGLQKIKERFGAAWEGIAERAERICRNTIERHLGPGDIYSAFGGLAFVMVFARLTPEQAKVKCRAIADEISRALLGDKGGDLLEVKTAVKRVDGTLDLESVALADQLFASLSTADELEFAEPPVVAALPADKAAPKRASSAAERISPQFFANLRVLYRPFWDRARNVVSAYLAFAQVLSADGRAVLGEAGALLDGDPDERARLDDILCVRILDDLSAMAREGRQFLLALPVHFDTLSAVGRRREFLAALERPVAQGATRHLLVEIAGVPAGVPPPRLAELTAMLHRQCRGILLSLPLDSVDFGIAKSCGAAAIGCDISAVSIPEAQLLQHMNRFARAAEKAGVPSYLHGAKSLSRAVAAIGAGFSYIDGSAVATPVDHPRGVVNFRLDDLYHAFMKG